MDSCQMCDLVFVKMWSASPAALDLLSLKKKEYERMPLRSCSLQGRGVWKIGVVSKGQDPDASSWPIMGRGRSLSEDSPHTDSWKRETREAGCLLEDEVTERLLLFLGSGSLLHSFFPLKICWRSLWAPYSGRTLCSNDVAIAVAEPLLKV